MHNLARAAKILTAIALFIICIITPAISTTNMNFKNGSYIIDMGQFPCTYANGLRPYGLIYDLVRNKEVPVYWAINSSKAKDGIDFTVDGHSFRGGSFIIPAEYASVAQATIQTWNATGVAIYGPTTNPFTAPIYDYICSFPNTVVDLTNGLHVINAFYKPSGVPASSYRLGTPESLSNCDDFYVLPHADPQKWTTYQQTHFESWINSGGFLWLACHAVDVFESPDYLAYYFLTTAGVMRWGTHHNPIPPYTYNISSIAHPVMQFVGRLDNALQTGSERVYLPLGSSHSVWRPTTMVAVYDPDHPSVPVDSPGPAGIVAYGHAFGDPAKGFIVYEAGHSISPGNESEDVDGARVFANELLMTGIMKRPTISVNIPSPILSGQTVAVSVTVTNGTYPYTITWTSSNGGTFADPHASATTFTAPTTSVPTTFILRVEVRDSCGRQDFYAQPTTLDPSIMSLSKTDCKSITEPGAFNNYTINYKNTGTVNASSVVVTDRLHPELTYIPTAKPSPTGGVITNASGTYLTWNLGNVTPGSNKLIYINSTVKDTVTVGTQVIDDVSLTYTAFSKTSTITAQDVDNILPLTKAVNRTEANEGNYLRYNLTPGYDGTTLLTNAKVIDAIPYYTAYVTNSANASGTWFPANKTIVWNLGSNQAGTTGHVAPTSPTVGYFKNVSINDTSLNSNGNNANKNYGGSTYIEMQNNGGKNLERGILYFDKPTLPTGATFSTAILNVSVIYPRTGGAIGVYRLNRSWCLHPEAQCNSCNNLIVEGTRNGAEPTSPYYGATWYCYNHQSPSLNCVWTNPGADGDYSSTLFGTLDASGSGGRRTVDVTNLVRGWYNGSYPNQGILLRQTGTANNYVQIGSKENTDSPDAKPYLNISYTKPGLPGTNVSIRARPLLGTGNHQVIVNMTVNATAAITVTPPATLTITATNSATATLASGPTPPGPVSMLANKNYYITYVYNTKPGTNPGTLKFTGKPTSPGANFADSTSNSVIVTPMLSYRVQINSTHDYSVSQILNNATIKDNTAMPAGSLSNTVMTNMTYPAAINVTKAVNQSYGSYCTKVNFTINVTNTGKNTLNPVVVKDRLPAGLDYVSSNGGSEYLGNVTWTLGALKKDEVFHLYLIAHIDGSVYGVLTNRVTANGTAPNGTIVTSQATRDVTAQKASIYVTKSANITSEPPCKYVNFKINVTNNGAAVLNPVTVQDYWTDGLTYISSNATSWNTTAQTATWNDIGPLNVGQTKRLDLVMHIDGSYFGEIGNTVLVEGKPPKGGNVTDYNYTIVTALQPNVSINKSVNLTQGPPCTKLNFTLNVTNNGQVIMSPVKVVDTLPYGLEYVSSNGSAVGNVVTWTDIGSLSPGRSRILYLVAHINGSVYGVLTNRANVTATSPTGLKYYANDTQNVTAMGGAIAVNKTVNLTEGSPGTAFNFTLNVTNTGQVIMSPVMVVDTLPYGFEYVSSNGSAVYNTVTWSDIGPLNPSQSKKLYLVARINGSAYGVLTNIVNVTATSPTSLKYYANDTRSVTALRASVDASKAVNLTDGSPSTNVNFTINVTNTGEVTLNPVQVVDTIPNGLDYVSSNGTHVGNTVTWTNVGPLTPGQLKSRYLVAHINGLVYGPLNNTVNVTGGYNVTAHASRIVTAERASIEVNKSSNVSSGFAGTYVNFTLNVTNTGEVNLDPVEVVDTLPYGMIYISSNGTDVGNVVTWDNIGPLIAGQFKKLYLVAQINGSVVGPMYNTVNVTGTPPHGNNVTNSSSKEVIGLAGAPSIMVNKDADPTEAIYMQNITFTIEVTNTGNSALDPVKVIDVLPDGLTYLSDDSGGSAAGKTITWNNVGPLAFGASTFIHMIAFVDGDKFGYLTNYVNATGKPEVGSNVTDNDTAVVEALYNPNMEIVKTAMPDTAGPGDNVTFIINVTNTGNIPLSTVRVVDILPVGMVYVSDNRSGSVSDNVITWSNVGPLARDQSTYISLNATVSI
jgi:uncharacterized repeat protein (TIGR01451 family)